MKGNNQVALYQSPTQYPGGIQIVVQGGPTAAFLLGGSPGTAASYTGGPYVARFEPLTCSTDYSKLKQPNTSPTALKVPFTP